MAVIGPESQLRSLFCPLTLLSPPFHRYWSHGHYLNILQTKKKKIIAFFGALVTHYLGGTVLNVPLTFISFTSDSIYWLVLSTFYIRYSCDLNLALLESSEVSAPHHPL